MKRILSCFMVLFCGCVGIPENVQPVQNFSVQKYLGTWYEIARFDHSFEQGLSRTTAEYSLNDGGGIRVVNRGYIAEEKKWKESEGKAYFVDREDLGYLKVAFFRPFYASYIVMDLDRENYRHSLVCGPDKSYLWILSRTPQLGSDTLQMLVQKAFSFGFDTTKLMYVQQ